VMRVVGGEGRKVTEAVVEVEAPTVEYSVTLSTVWKLVAVAEIGALR